MVEGAAEALRRRRDFRPDLPGEIISPRPSCFPLAMPVVTTAPAAAGLQGTRAAAPRPAGLRADPGFHAVLPVPDRAHPAVRGVHQNGGHGMGTILHGGDLAPGDRGVQVSFGASLAAAAVNLFAGLLVAWVLVRYRFPGKRLVDAIVDLPFALPTAVAGIALTQIYAPNGWLGKPLAALGVHAAYSWLGVAIALTFIELSVRGSHRAAGARGFGQAIRGGVGQPGGDALANLPPRGAAGNHARVADRFRAWLSPAPSASTAR